MKSVIFAAKIACERPRVDVKHQLRVSSASLGKFKIWTDITYDIQTVSSQKFSKRTKCVSIWCVEMWKNQEQPE